MKTILTQVFPQSKNAEHITFIDSKVCRTCKNDIFSFLIIICFFGGVTVFYRNILWRFIAFDMSVRYVCRIKSRSIRQLIANKKTDTIPFPDKCLFAMTRYLNFSIWSTFTKNKKNHPKFYKKEVCTK